MFYHLCMQREKGLGPFVQTKMECIIGKRYCMAMQGWSLLQSLWHINHIILHLMAYVLLFHAHAVSQIPWIFYIEVCSIMFSIIWLVSDPNFNIRKQTV